jgi:hypothetical protein
MAEKGETRLEQQRRAARKHGIRAYEDRGEESLTHPQRSRLAELKDLVQDKQGVVELLKERAARAVLIIEMAEAWVEKEAQEGKTFDEIGVIRRLGTYQETARRALSDLLKALPNDKDILDITDLLKGGKSGKK